MPRRFAHDNSPLPTKNSLGRPAIDVSRSASHSRELPVRGVAQIIYEVLGLIALALAVIIRAVSVGVVYRSLASPFVSVSLDLEQRDD